MKKIIIVVITIVEIVIDFYYSTYNIMCIHIYIYSDYVIIYYIHYILLYNIFGTAVRFARTLNERLVLMMVMMMNHQHHDHLQPKTLDPEPHVGPNSVGALFHV